MWTEKDTLGRMGNAHGTEKGKQGLKRASWELERHTHCWKGHVWRLEKHMAYEDVEKGTVVAEEGTCGLNRMHFC